MPYAADPRADDWPADIFDALMDLDVRQVAYVPDSGHARLIELCRAHKGIRAIPLTTEEEGVALLAGAWLGGQRGALLMQSSGVGNCINMLSMIRACRFPLFTLITMRGQWGEVNPWQLPMGQTAAEALGLAGVMVREVWDASEVGETVRALAQMVFDGQMAAAVLLSQRLIGSKTFGR